MYTIDELRGLEGRYFMHFKGKIYKLIGLILHVDTQEELVLYQSVSEEDKKMYLRSVDSFVGKIDKTKYTKSRQDYRFELIKEVL